MRPILPALIAFILLPLAGPARAQSNDPHSAIHQFFGTLEQWADRLADRSDEFQRDARQAIIMGGAVISENRNLLSGGILGCALGATAAGGATALLGVPTGGEAAAAAPDAAVAGCLLGAAAGASLGYQLDYPTGRP
jgi:hypothetical protein